VIALALAAWLAGAAAAGSAAEPDEDEGQAAPADVDGPPEEQKNESGEPRTRAPGGVEVFIPSEEISEDFAVSFPVDI
jgi:hypothetical protein